MESSVQDLKAEKFDRFIVEPGHAFSVTTQSEFSVVFLTYSTVSSASVELKTSSSMTRASMFTGMTPFRTDGYTIVECKRRKSCVGNFKIINGSTAPVVIKNEEEECDGDELCPARSNSHVVVKSFIVKFYV